MPAARRVSGLVAIWLAGAACSPEQILGGNDALPPGTSDPADTQTEAGALAAYRGTLMLFRDVYAGGSNTDPYLPSHVVLSALLGDEFQGGEFGSPPAGVGFGNFLLIDSRTIEEFDEVRSEQPTPTTIAYSMLQAARAQAYEARGLLGRYAPDASPALRGHLLALTGYLEISLGEIYCSGVPLSTMDFDGDYTYQPGSTTHELFEHARALLDSAEALSGDSARIAGLAAVGQARALLALGRYAEAAQAVADVPTSFQYALQFSQANDAPSFRYAFVQPTTFQPVSIADGKGMNGLDYVTADDPRVRTTPDGTGRYGLQLFAPVTTSPVGDDPVVIASGIEARLVEAEAALATGGGSWLDMLDALRTDGTFTTQPDASDPAVTDTTWNAGTGGVAGLRPLEDPGSTDARIDLVFRERAFWLFLGGQRQGDLRRLVREYDRSATAVYPTGTYGGANGAYADEVTAPISARERRNPLFTGCFDRNA